MQGMEMEFGGLGYGETMADAEAMLRRPHILRL
jgi:hypothetical protein